MQIVIDISQEDYERIKSCPDCFDSLASRAYSSIKNSTPLPKGHGNIYDENYNMFTNEELDAMEETFCNEGLSQLADEIRRERRYREDRK